MRAGIDGAQGEQATPAQFGAFMAALRLKGETVEEITGMAQAMREHALRLDVKVQPLLDTAGTGGSKKVFNASTAGAFVAAAAQPDQPMMEGLRSPLRSGCSPYTESPWI